MNKRRNQALASQRAAESWGGRERLRSTPSARASDVAPAPAFGESDSVWWSQGRGSEAARANASDKPKSFAPSVKGVNERSAPRETVLFVEDNDWDAALVESLLARIDRFEVTRASSLRAALSLSAKNRYSLILTDLTLPDASHVDAIVQLVTAAPSAAVVAISGSLEAQVSLECFRAGAQDFLLKDSLDNQRLDTSLCLAREHKISQTKLERLAHEDPLTGLYNRRMFHERLEQHIARSRRAKQGFAVAFLDLDHFKAVNDRYGHEAGDELLCAASQRILRVVRDYDTVARMGGDEFAILLENLESVGDEREIAERLVRALGEPYRLAGQEILATPSLGLAVYPDVAETAEDLIGCADAAMYDVKRANRNGYQIYGLPAPARRAPSMDFQQVLQSNDFELLFQPQFEIATGNLVAVEALLRLKRGNQLLVPEQFIYDLESSPAVQGVGRWAMREACFQLREWQRRYPALRMNVNVFAQQVESNGLLQDVESALYETGVAPRNLALEIGENVLMRDGGSSLSVLSELKERGVGIVLDNYGTGYSSISRLSQLPVDTLKIDRAYVGLADECPRTAAVASACIGLARQLGLTVVGGGVECHAQLEFLRSHKCDVAQGYLLGRPAKALPDNPNLSPVSTVRHR